MFNLSGSELVFLLLIALIVLGPEKLPEAMRRFGKVYSEVRKMSTGFQSELKTALDEPMREMRETADALRKAANFDFDDGPETEEPARSTAAQAGMYTTILPNEPPLVPAAAPAAEPAAAPVVDVPAVDTAATPQQADAVDVAEPAPLPPGINFGSANPRPTAALRDVSPSPEPSSPPAEGATTE